jgi:hypothetical protein
LNEGKVVGSKPVIARRHPTTLFDPVKEPLDPVASAVEIGAAWSLLVKPPRDLPIDWRWYLVMQAPCCCTRTMEVSIIWTVASASMMRLQTPARRHLTKRL